MSKLIINESTLTSIGDAIRNKEGSIEKISLNDMSARIEAIGGGDEIQWTDIARSLSIYSLNSLGKSKVEIYLPNLRSLGSFCKVSNDANVNTTVEELTIRCDQQVTSIVSMLECGYDQADRKLRKLTLYVDTSKATQVSVAFQALRALEEIVGTPLDVSSATSLGGMFNYCYNLREVRFAGEISQNLMIRESKKLSKDSIVSVMSCLSNETNGLSLTLSAEAVNTAFETSEGAADGSSSAEWTALVEAHTNWTISLI